jgi:DNA-binding MarR family transcriptional regulator
MSSRNRDTLIGAVSTAIMRWQDATQAFDEAVGEQLELSTAERHCLGFLHEGPKTAGAIAKAVALTPAAVTALIDRLETRGFVERRRDEKDRRQVHVVLTEMATTMAMKYYGPIATEGAALLGTMTTAEIEIVKNFLDRALALQQRQTDKIRALSGKKTAGSQKPRAKG